MTKASSVVASVTQQPMQRVTKSRTWLVLIGSFLGYCQYPYSVQSRRSLSQHSPQCWFCTDEKMAE